MLCRHCHRPLVRPSIELRLWWRCKNRQHDRLTDGGRPCYVSGCARDGELVWGPGYHTCDDQTSQQS